MRQQFIFLPWNKKSWSDYHQRKLKFFLDLHFNGQLLTPVTYIVLYIAKVSIQVLDKFECSLDKISVTTTVHTSARLSMRKGGGTSLASPNTIKKVGPSITTSTFSRWLSLLSSLQTDNAIYIRDCMSRYTM